MHPTFKSSLLAAAFIVAQLPVASHAADITLYLHGNEYPSQSLAIDEMDVWERMRKGFAIPDLDNPLVISQTNWYSARPDYIQRTTTRASRYLYHVVEELEKRNMPMELALLPFIESAFNPQALSTAKAAGMWQFIPSTGRDYDLKQSAFKDERRDVLASTEAALSYLQRLYGMFGDWQLALAAYNWGEGSVQRAINKNRAAGLPTDFNGLSRLMPAETQNYVPKLQAVKNIIAHPEQYGITLPRVDNQPYFVTVGKTRDIDIKLAAQLAELSLEEFKALNPQFNRPVIIGSANTQILLPKNNAAKFKENLSNWGKTLSSWTAHKVTGARERIDAIAKRFGTTPQVIREVNNIPPKMALKEGSTILVPRTELTAEKDIGGDVADTAIMQVVPDVPDTRRIHVKVGKRDTLASLAQKHKVSVAQIKDWNHLTGDKVATGKTLELHVPNRLAARDRDDDEKRTAVARKGADEKPKTVTRKGGDEKPKVLARKDSGDKRKTARSERTRATQTASGRKAASGDKSRKVASADKSRNVASKKTPANAPTRKQNRTVKVASR